MKILNYNNESHFLEEEPFEFVLKNVEEPCLYREIYPYDSIPKLPFNHRHVNMNFPKNIWITDTTFRDGQQSREPYTVKQISDIYDMMHELDGGSGIIKQTEFFLYSKNDREALEECLSKGYKFPEITTWIRALKKDFALVKDIGIKETGILVSCSDYHIFKKMNMNRDQAFNHYTSVISDVLEAGLIPRCHFEDVTRADFYGFVVPLISKFVSLATEGNIPIKIRLCDTLGLGVPYSGAAMPRSVPGLISGLSHHCDVKPEQIEWHGHNDFYKGVVNATTAWLYGASAVNCSLFGIGERTGNVPLEAMVMEYASLRGLPEEVNLEVITKLAEYYEKEIGYIIPPMTPFVGKHFNETRAGIHADGLLKDEEIYNIFDTQKLLNRPVNVCINQHSGLAGLTYWYNRQYSTHIEKNDPIIEFLNKFVTKEYENGRQTAISNCELAEQVEIYNKTK